MQPFTSSTQLISLDAPVEPRLGKQFAAFVSVANRIVRSPGLNAGEICSELELALKPLLADRAWIPADLTVPAATEYRRECLYEAHDGAFSIGVFTWVPRHISRIHDHYAWAVLGNITGILRSENFLAVTPGRVVKHVADDLLHPGGVLWSTPETGDIHRVSVASSEEKSISIHVYGSRFDAVNREYYTDIADEEDC
jgi:3-mercaptopropionate dioxygenase